MRYIVKATKLNEYDPNVEPYIHTVYDGKSLNKAKKILTEYMQYGGVSFESK